MVKEDKKLYPFKEELDREIRKLFQNHHFLDIKDLEVIKYLNTKGLYPDKVIKFVKNEKM